MRLSSHCAGVTFLLILVSSMICPGQLSGQMIFPNAAISTVTNNCDFCLASQGISPLEVGSSGVRLDLRYLRVGNVYHDGAQVENSRKELETHLTQQFSFFQAISPRVTISAMLPVASRHSEILSDGGGIVTGNQFGLGDVSLLLRYKPLVGHGMETTYILSVTAGVKLPSGRTNGRDSGGNLLDAHVQLGSGSTDFLGGVSGFLTFDRVALITNLLGAITRHGANGHTFGNSLNYDATVRYKVYPDEYADTQVFATLGVNGEWRGQEIEGGIRDENSGGNVTYLSPGVQVFLTPSVSFEMLFQYPVLHGLYGEQLGESYRVTTGVQLLF